MYKAVIFRGILALTCIALSGAAKAASYELDSVTFPDLPSVNKKALYGNGDGYVDYSVYFGRPGLFKVSIRAMATVIGDMRNTSFQWGYNYHSETTSVQMTWRWNGREGAAPGASYQYMANGLATVNCNATAMASTPRLFQSQSLNFRSSGSTSASATEAKRSKSVAFLNVGGVAQAFKQPIISGCYTVPTGQYVGAIGSGLNDVGALSQGGSGVFALEEWVYTPAGAPSFSTTVIYSAGVGLGMTGTLELNDYGKGTIDIESQAAAVALATSITPYH